jgi:hypothetical protein
MTVPGNTARVKTTMHVLLGSGAPGNTTRVKTTMHVLLGSDYLLGSSPVGLFTPRQPSMSLTAPDLSIPLLKNCLTSILEVRPSARQLVEQADHILSAIARKYFVHR